MELRLATFNLENLGIRADEDSPQLRERLPKHVASLRGTLRRLDADAVAVQEVLDAGLLAELAEGLGYAHLELGPQGSSPLRVGVLSRYPLRTPRPVAGEASFSVSDPKTGLEISVRGTFSRAALHVVWDVPEFPLSLYVVHWKSKIPSWLPGARDERGGRWPSHGSAGEGRLLTEVKRLAQAVELRKEVDAALRAADGGRVAVLGDFNDTLESEALRIVRGDARACGAPALAEEELYPCELSIPEDRRYSQLYRGRKEMLDHILLSRNLLPHLRSAAALNEDLAEAAEGPATDPYSAASDHAPLVVTLKV